jgi:hypothetical protein
MVVNGDHVATRGVGQWQKTERNPDEMVAEMT